MTVGEMSGMEFNPHVFGLFMCLVCLLREREIVCVCVCV